MRGIHRFAVSVLTAIFTVAVVHAQPPSEEEGEEGSRNLDELAAEEFVRDLREAAEASRDEATQDSEADCGAEPCTSIAELLAVIQYGPSPSERESDEGDQPRSTEEAEGEGDPDE